MLKDRKIIQNAFGICNRELLVFLYAFLDSTNNDYNVISINGEPYLISTDKYTRIRICQTASRDDDDVACRVESKNNSFLTFRTRLSDCSIFALDGILLVNNNMYVINPNTILNGNYTEISIDTSLFELNNNSNIGLTFDNASLLGCLWYNPDAFIDEKTGQNVRKIGKKID